MQYMRMLANSALGGALGAAFLCMLVLQLNPQVPLAAGTVAPLYLRLIGSYGVFLTAVFAAIIMLPQVFSRSALSPGWLSLRLLAWMSAVLAGGASVLMWANVTGSRLSLEQEPARRMAAGAAATAVCALLLLVIAVVHFSFGRRGSRTAGLLFAATVCSAVVLPAVARGWGHSPPVRAIAPAPAPVLAPAPFGGRVVLILLDGASLEYITPATAEGRLPHFGRMLDGGASLHLTTVQPTQPATVWAAAGTGKYPSANGVRSASTFGFGHPVHRLDLLPDFCFSYALVSAGVLERRDNDGSALRPRPLWEILSRMGLDVGVVAWPLSDPVRPVRGYLVSDRLHRAQIAAAPFEGARYVYPPDAFAPAGPPPMPAALNGWATEAATEAVARPSSVLAGQGLLARDVWYRRIAATLEARYRPQVTALRYEGIDVAGHHFLRYAMPHAFGDVTGEERQRLGQVLERQYASIDEEIGAYLATLGPEDVLMVLSGFGMEPVTLAKRTLAWAFRQDDLSGTHERGPAGFLLAYGGPVAAGRRPVGSIVDVTPTVLYLIGLPVGRDMDGYARTDLFKRNFTAERPITFIRTYD
jgi:hypothetical protein